MKIGKFVDVNQKNLEINWKTWRNHGKVMEFCQSRKVIIAVASTGGGIYYFYAKNWEYKNKTIFIVVWQPHVKKLEGAWSYRICYLLHIEMCLNVETFILLNFLASGMRTRTVRICIPNVRCDVRCCWGYCYRGRGNWHFWKQWSGFSLRILLKFSLDRQCHLF